VDIHGGAQQVYANKDVTLILSFINKEKDPSKLPVVKKYQIRLDEDAHLFLK
jgi:hypothetical protein